MRIEAKLTELGLVLPAPPEPPPGFQFAFEWARIRDHHVYLSGHAAQRRRALPHCPCWAASPERSATWTGSAPG